MAPSTNHETYVSNIIDAWNALSDEDIAKGRAWYPVAHDIAVGLGNGDARMGAGILAALSPLKSWHENVKLATQASEGNVRGHFPDALGKVRAIMAGSDPANVLPMDMKTGNFYQNILDPSDAHAVTVDRHAAHLATGSPVKGGLKLKAYREIADAYRDAAKRLGEIPSVVQAGIWGPMARVGY
jgi:hypothetical protein